MKWYQKSWAIILLLIFFFPAGAYLMWKEKKNWFKPVKVGLSVVLGTWFLLFSIATFSDIPTESNTVGTKKLESKTVEVKKDETKTAEKKANIKLTETSLTMKDNEEKEVRFTLENIKQSDVKAVVKDGSIARSELKDGVCIVKGISKGSTILEINSSKDNTTLTKINVVIEESEETIAKRQAEEKAEAERIAQEKAEQERIVAEQAEAERIAQEQAAQQAEAERVAEEQAAQAQQNANQIVQNIPESTEMVWKSATGDCYHSINNCGRMNPNKATQITRAQAESQGLTACSKCY